MVKILFISVNDVNTEGLRSMSANLKKNGYQPYIIFLKRHVVGKKNLYALKKIEEYDWVGINEKGKEFRFCRGPEVTITEKKLLLSLIEDIKPNLIGFSVTSPLKKRNAEISKLIKNRYDIPIIWGGADPTIDAEDCLNYCDIVCVGEGEKTIIDIANQINNKKDIKNVKNLAYFKNGQLIQNTLYPLITNLDELPFKDIYANNKFLIEDDSLLRNFNEVSYSRNLKYHTISSRGCPYNCSYCCENFFKKLYSPQMFLRRRSPYNVIRELKEAKEIINCKEIIFEDEIFSFDYNWLKEFKSIYIKEIGLPFMCYIYPNKNIEKQLRILKEMGIAYTCLAVQSGSEEINKEIFNRPFDKELFLKTADILKLMKIGFYTDIITYNPFESEKDLQATLDILNQLPKPFGLCVNKFYAIKGTKIYDMVEYLKDNKEKTLVSNKIFSYYSRLFWLTTHYNKHIVEFFRKIIIFKYFPFLTSWLLDLTRLLIRIMRKTKRVIKKLFYR